MANKYNKKLTCYYCMYEINNKKTVKYVIYNGTKKIICRYCTVKKHKPLNDKFKGFDILCTTCKKPVKYNKCLP